MTNAVANPSGVDDTAARLIVTPLVGLAVPNLAGLIDNGVAEALQARGYVVLRFTGREILQDGAMCIARVRRALERAAEQSAA